MTLMNFGINRWRRIYKQVFAVNRRDAQKYISIFAYVVRLRLQLE